MKKILLYLMFITNVAHVFSQTPATALNFEGPVDNTYDYITVADDPSLDFTDSFTFETWVNFDFITRDDNGWDWQCLFAKSQYNASYGLMYLSDSAFPRGVTFYHTGFGSGATTYRWPTVAANTWYHIAVTLSPTKATIYLDGVEVMSQTGTGTLTSNNDPLFIGANNTGGGDPYPLDGTLEETRFWNTTRTQAEIAASMNDQLNGNETGLVLQFSYNQGNVNEDNTAITTVTDNSTEGNNGTLTQFALTGTASNFVDGSGAGVDFGLEQTITFNALADKTTDDAPFQLMATSDSGLPVSYTSSNLAVAIISGDMVTIVGEGSTTITASQAGDATYKAAADVEQIQLVTLGTTNPCDPGNDSFAPSFTNVDGNTTQTVQLDAMGNISITPESFGITAVDNCTASPVFSLSQTDFTCSDTGSNTIQLTVTDDQNNSDSIDVTVIIEDDENPVIDASMATTTFELDPITNEITITAADLNIPVTDNCSATLNFSDITYDCTDLGSKPTLLTATDASGNSSFPMFITIVITETEAPIANCAAPFTMTLDPATNSATITVEQINDGSTDNCTIDTITIDKDTFNCNDIGANTITLTVTDEAGNTDTCSTIVTIDVDTTCPSDMVINNDPGVCGAVVVYGGCNNTLIEGLPSGSVFPIGTTLNVFELTDNNGATVQCSFSVTVSDNEFPSFLTQDGTINLDANGMASIQSEDFIREATDYNLDTTGIFNPIDISASGTVVTLGDDEVSSALPIGFNFSFYGYVYTDFYISSNGFITFSDENEDGCCGFDAIPDNSSPNNLIALDMTDLDPSEGGIIRYTTIGTAPNRITIIDFDGIHYYHTTPDATTTQLKLFESTNVIEIHTTSTLDSGNNKVQGIENIDSSEAVVVPGRNSAVWTSTNDYVAFIPKAIDNCSAAVTASQTDFDCSNLGSNTITITATDASGNITSQTVDITVEDISAPVISCPVDVTVIADGSGMYAIPDYFTTQSITVTDNCTDPVTITRQDPIAGTNLAIGDHTITLYATDAASNEGSCTFTLTVDPTLGTTENIIDGLSIYPNPADSRFTITNPSNVTLKSITIHQLDGKTVKYQKLNNENLSVDISNLASGLYLIKIEGKSGTYIQRLIKK